MKDEKVLTIEEMKAQYKALGEKIAQKEKAEAEEREAKLAAEKEARYKEIIAMFDNLETLIKNWHADYGNFVFHGKSNTIPYLWHLFF